MFRRIASTLPQDVIVPANLEAMGYFLNDDDQIRQIRNPEQAYQFKVNANDRINDMYKEAMNSCVRNIVKDRLTELGIQTLRLPLGTGAAENHVPIYLSSGIETKKRVIVSFPGREIDPTILSFRVASNENINSGSIINFVKGAMTGPTATSDAGAPGVIITNPSQLFWFRGGQRAVTANEWLSLPRPSSVHTNYRMDSVKNLVPGNENSNEHVKYIFEHVLGDLVDQDAKLDIVGVEWAGKEAVEYLSANWTSWADRVSSICFANPQHRVEDLITQYDASTAFLDFLSKKCRAYFISHHPAGTIVEGRPEIGCNCFASEEELYADQILVRSWGAMLDHFNAIHTLPNFEEAERYTRGELDGHGEDELPN